MKDAQTGSPAPLDPVLEADATHEAPATGAPADRAEISSAALELNGQRALSGAPELPGERLRIVLDRLSGGFYDREDVRHEVAMDIARDLDSSGR